MSYYFYAMMQRLSMIPRWNGTYSLKSEDVAQHSFNVVVFTHALCMIKKQIFNEEIDIEKALEYAIFHDSTDSITTHIISPIKNHSSIKENYTITKQSAKKHLIKGLPIELQSSYFNTLHVENMDIEYIVEVADQLDGYCKAIFEVKRGNSEFKPILSKFEDSLGKLASEHEYIKYFLDNFIPSFLDEENNFKNMGVL
ncbi:5'-deoxynucleotidase [Bacillus sp. SCS-151]|uniref:5'-deoxynucleotidase n=1 Tax=Nanhaiella sioensis TaxID=3115293 RepID=UPI00397CE8E4